MPVTIDGTTGITSPAAVVSGDVSATTLTLPAGSNVQRMLLSTAQNTTSGTSIDFTGIPSWAKKITVMLNGVSTSGTSLPMVQLGTSGGVQTTSYVSGAWQSNITNTTNTTGVILTGSGLGADTLNSTLVLYLIDAGTGKWVGTGTGNLSISGNGEVCSGSKTLSGTLDRIRLTTVNGTDTFDAGSVNILIEGY